MSTSTTGADPGFQVRGGGGAHIKNCAERKEARKFWGYFVCKNKILRQKKIIFFPIAKGGAKLFGGISCEKSRFYGKKSYIFQF